jgi:hypothetical protein
MLANQAQFLTKMSGNLLTTFISRDYAVWDWLRLGIFTGSRRSEYAQSGLHKNQRFQVIPVNGETGVWGGQPLAFIRADFQFFDSEARRIPQSDVYRLHKRGQVRTVHVRFRYDKSAENFSIRKYSVSSDPILDPVNAAVSILHRADALQVPMLEPVGVYCNHTSGQYSFL